jgi:pre-mRNA-processing factor 19
MPPRLPSAASLPALLSSVQSEYDALLLELYDTRRTLEDTRRELSQALYQNDASVRVVARLVMERDGAREQLAAVSAQVAAAPAAGPAAAAGPALAEAAAAGGGGDGSRKRAREEDAEAQGETKKAKEANGGADAGGKIPQSDLDSMMATWKALSKDRKKKSKNKDKDAAAGAAPATSTGVTMETVQSMEETGKKSLHKSSAKAGMVSIASLSGGSLIVTAGRDRQAVVYNTDAGKVVATLVGSGGSKADLVDADIVKSVDDGAVLVATGSSDGALRVYSSPAEDGDAPAEFAPCGTITLAEDSIVNVSVHPSGKYVVAALQSGRVAFAALRDGGVLEEVAVLDGNAAGAEYTCADLHPDGLIYVVGTAAGAVQVWDLSKQTPAGSVQAQGGGDEGVSIASIVMSDNGYHVATSTTAGTVQVWDLRKLKCVATLNADGADVGSVVKSVSFSPGEGKLLAYGGANGTIAVVGVKDWDNKTTLSVTPPKKGDAATITGLVWTHGGMSMVSCSDTDRPVRFWGTKE